MPGVIQIIKASLSLRHQVQVANQNEQFYIFSRDAGTAVRQGCS